jgi:hypothetical protein
MQLAALFMEAHPEAAVLREHILDRHRDDGSDTREAVEHEGDQRLVAQTNMRRAADAIEQGTHFGRIEDRRRIEPYAGLETGRAIKGRVQRTIVENIGADGRTHAYVLSVP